MSSVPEASGGRTVGKGLRHFSMKVCEKVESKGRTTYNEVADELVKDYSSPETAGAKHHPLLSELPRDRSATMPSRSAQHGCRN